MSKTEPLNVNVIYLERRMKTVSMSGKGIGKMDLMQNINMTHSDLERLIHMLRVFMDVHRTSDEKNYIVVLMEKHA